MDVRAVSEPSANARAVDGTNTQASVTEAPRAAWYMVVILSICYVYGYVDRQVLVLLVGPLKADLHLTDTQISLLLGISFALSYTVCGLIVGYLTDRFNRRAIMGIGIVIWSAMTAGSGLAQNFLHLLAGRLGVGLGESVITPVSYSLIRDGFSADRRGRAFSIFQAAAMTGHSIALLISGAAVALASSRLVQSMPVAALLHPWQLVLLIVGIGGFPLVLLLLTFREPARTLMPTQDASAKSYYAALRQMALDWRIYLPLLVMSGCAIMEGLSFAIWIPTHMMRAFGLTAPQVAATLGVIILVCGTTGNLVGGALSDWLTRRGFAGPEMVSLVAFSCAFPAVLAAPVVHDLTLSWVLQAVSLFFGSATMPVGSALLSRYAPSHQVGKMSAIYLTVQTLLGPGLAPLLVARISDGYFQGPRAIGQALSIVGATAFATSAICALILLRQGRHHRQRFRPA